MRWKPEKSKWLLSFRRMDGSRDMFGFYGTFEGVRSKRDGLMRTGRYFSCWIIEER